MALDVDVDNRDKYLSLVDNEHSANQLKMFPHVVNIFMAFLSYLVTLRVIPKLKDKFIKANLFGIDMSKTTSDKVPESLGVVSGFIFLVTMVLFIPVAFGNSLLEKDAFPYDEYVKYILALLSICCMLLLGFADDVLDVPWRQKLLLPTIASLPLLMVYYVSFNTTSIIVPKPFREWLGVSLDIGIIYYVYMGMLAVFCTNAINILAGVNGLEAGQSVVIAISIAIFNLLELSGPLWKAHQFSLYFMWPYIGTSLALLKHNWYPASVFVGDTFCYFSGMTFAVVGILGRFSKTALLFFIPQVFNFLYSFPQLMKLIPCPRHRLPKFNSRTDKMECSTTVFQYSELSVLGKIVISLFRVFRLIRWEEKNGVVVTNNFTLINLVLLYFGPMHEAKLSTVLLGIQFLCTLLAFVIRYPFASVFYDVDSVN
ncbi:UDP-N-acetylglucosamine--dolichyl-phosphate N-acetylglucosaminephosphotransferase [Dendroctonus ponderosae]|uniref:UDP-N-acetylglucosamine--dolichyl-phosphate N-acetylglucosaminephosphotransferase n=1 Tax=Dendroctonus ponderosae TaxID=77166 RepID=UPI0020354015|nr:UDP-N-acetylglucosamine--dolichyl-phosphate N-acetylglucosaminephosphotransferase [Dendroctonus ponderosae]